MTHCANIQTGYAVPSPSNCNSDLVVASPGNHILFCPESPMDQKYSPSFTVTPGQVILIDAYNMPDSMPIYVNRIVLSSSPECGACYRDPCKTMRVESSGQIIFRERMTLGNDRRQWQLFKTSTFSILQMMIMIPGTYELELSDVSMLGDLEVEYMRWNLPVTPNMPFSYFAGSSQVPWETGYAE